MSLPAPASARCSSESWRWVVEAGWRIRERASPRLATWLENDPRVEAVTYAGLKSSPWYRRGRKVCPKGAGALFTFQLAGGYDACVRLVDSVDLFSHVANLGDARSLILHPASTTHRQLSDEQRALAGAGNDTVRLSIGIEDADDLIRDLDQALAKAAG